MLALIYLALAIALGDALCRQFYRFMSVSHRWAAGVLVGILLSTWFTYLSWLAFAHTAGPLLSADLLFFIVAAGAIFWLSRKAPKVDMIAPRAPGSSRWDWITLAALFAAACVLLIGTLYVNKQGRLLLSGTLTSDLSSQLAFAQSFGLGHDFPTEFARYASKRSHDQFLFYFQAGNLEFLGLNLAWSVDVLSVLGLTSMLALVMALAELLFNSRVVGRLGATLFFFNGSLRYLTNFLASGHPDRDQTGGFWKQIAFVNQRHLPFAIGIFLLVLIFLLDQYRQRSLAAGTTSDANIALRESKRRSAWNQLKRGFASRFITSARSALTPAKSFVFSGLLLAALPLWNVSLFLAALVVLCCLFVAYGCWRLSRLKTPAMLGGVLTGTLTACILAAGVIDLLAVYSSSRVEINFEREPLLKGLVFRNSVIYKIPDSFAPRLSPEGPPKPPVTAFEGGHGNGRGQFDSPRGIATDSGGNIFVADTNNGRIEKFSPSGVFITSMGTSGKGHGQFREPNGLAVDRFDNIYVAEASNHRVQKLAPDGTLIGEWAPGFYGPRRIAIGPDCAVYVLDQGRTRIVKFSPDGRLLTTWGSGGNGDGQFADHTSVAVDPTSNKVYVADPINSRIQVFDSDGKFLAKWLVPEWGQPAGFEDLAIDSQRGRLYASSAHMNTILVFDLQGNRTGTLTPSPPDKINGPSALALATDKLFVLNTGSARVSVIPLPAR
jgi:DNA-binding beta-propeller fold protein YncE